MRSSGLPYFPQGTYDHLPPSSRILEFQVLFSAAGGARTHDLRIKSPLLYQLSYSGGIPIIAHPPVRRREGWPAHPTLATVSISTSIRGSIRAPTWTIVITGRISANRSPRARPTSSAREMSVT